MRITEAAVLRLVRKWHKRMRLADLWTFAIKIHHEESEETDDDKKDCEAYVTISDGYDHADITVNAWLFQPSDLELVIVHEMTHLVLRELTMLAEAGGTKKMSKVLEAAEERAVERLSRALLRR